ncbi:protein of unknown function [Methylorubrum extorquens DM4]|uniref:Uncharacterized protein n=1 Tax=Methylorubrum extorquens (strain DSM 6343 / CIP 106787 / DM4) TaxID=661410 RepID=C7CGU4_METED|nr:protein of unknown function [Methylorubrum extorquens DM4]
MKAPYPGLSGGSPTHDPDSHHVTIQRAAAVSAMYSLMQGSTSTVLHCGRLAMCRLDHQVEFAPGIRYSPYSLSFRC